MKLVLTIGTIIFSLMTLFLGFIFVQSLTFPYNSEGRYFDEASATVHHEQAVGVYYLSPERSRRIEGSGYER
jgi:hypothetical protein